MDPGFIRTGFIVDMAKERRQNVRKEQPQTSAGAQSKEVQAKPDSRFTFGEYLILNLVFWVFCLLQYVVVFLVTDEDLGLKFFFFALASGFTLVSVFSWCFDMFFPKQEEQRMR